MKKANTIKRALISVFDSEKEHMSSFVQSLCDIDIDLVSTGGTARYLRTLGIRVEDVSDMTHFPEILDGRVKTLHPSVHGGILARMDRPEHQATMDQYGIDKIDLVYITLYPFLKKICTGSSHEEIVENIDIGGLAMIRSAAKNYIFTVVIVDPDDCEEIIKEIKEFGDVSEEKRIYLAQKAFAYTAHYDSLIAHYFSKLTRNPASKWLTVSGTLNQVLRYGENPHQKSSLYQFSTCRGSGIKKECGKELSYNNVCDSDSALSLLRECMTLFPTKSVAVVVKHSTPCGVAINDDDDSGVAVYRRAFLADSKSAFGGIVAINRPLTKSLAQEITKVFVEVILVPEVANSAVKWLMEYKPNVRVLAYQSSSNVGDTDFVGYQGAFSMRSVVGGFLIQSCDVTLIQSGGLDIVTQRKPSNAEVQDSMFAFLVAKHARSNAVVLAKDGQTIGIGAGHVSRIDSVNAAIAKIKEFFFLEHARGAVMASDAFFPFFDSIDTVASAGITTVIQPGGSIKDADIITCANKNNIAMILTHERHMRH